MGFSTAALGSWAFGAGASVGLSAGAVSAIGTGVTAVAVGAAATEAMGALTPHGRLLPPSPVLSQASIDQGQQTAEQNALRRQSIAGGIDSSVGTSGGQGGQMLNPSNLGSKSLLGQ